jgi:DNA polymerase-3 subunit beta
MKVVADREALYRGFQRAGSVVSSGIQQPIYRNVKLSATEGDVYLTASDLEVGLRLRIPDVVVEKEGQVLLPPGRISSILANTPDDQVTISDTDGSVRLRSGDSDMLILGESPDDFVDLPELPEDGTAEIDAGVLRYMIRRTAFAAAPDRGRYALNGVLFVLGKEDSIDMVAADGSRLALVKKKVSNPGGIEASFVVQSRGVEQLGRLADYGEEPVRFVATENQFMAQNDAGRLVCQLVEGQFPNYQDVIPTDSKIKVQLPVREMLSAVRRAGYLTTDETRVVDFCFGTGELVIRAESPDVGRAEVKMSVEYEGEETRISFNPDFLEEMLSIVERESVKLRFSDRRSPCVLKAGLDFTYVVSPVVREEGTM